MQYWNVCLFFHSLKDKLKKVVLEKEQFECHLKTEKDEKELYKVTYFSQYDT